MERSPDRVVTRPNDDGWCFVCGRENPVGLKTVWTLDEDGTVRASFSPERQHQGWVGIVHGGILAALLDEAMAQRMWREGKPAVTASLSIRYRKPAPTTAKLVAEARVVSSRSHAARLEAIVRSESGECYAKAEGTCVRLQDSEV